MYRILHFPLERHGRHLSCRSMNFGGAKVHTCDSRGEWLAGNCGLPPEENGNSRTPEEENHLLQAVGVNHRKNAGTPAPGQARVGCGCGWHVVLWSCVLWEEKQGSFPLPLYFSCWYIPYLERHKFYCFWEWLSKKAQLDLLFVLQILLIHSLLAWSAFWNRKGARHWLLLALPGSALSPLREPSGRVPSCHPGTAASVSCVNSWLLLWWLPTTRTSVFPPCVSLLQALSSLFPFIPI